MTASLPDSASDAPATSWIDRIPYPAVRPYCRLARLDRPIGIWLLLLPCWWSTALASHGWPSLRLLLLFAVGAIIMRGAGCTINDIIDRDVDRQVARTRDRPVASGAISVPHALLFAAVLSLAGLVVLVQFKVLTIALGALSLVLVGLYPFAKRVTDWPQAVLGLTFNWGALLGWLEVHGSIGLPAVLLYAGGVAWTLAYDTIYAHQDREDDERAGVRSTARLFGRFPRPSVGVFFYVSIGLLVLAGLAADLHPAYYAGLVLAKVHAGWQTATLNANDRRNCLARFKSNRDFGLIVFLSIVAGQVIP